MAKKNETGKRMLFEATVAGGLPIFSLLNSSLQGFQCNYFQGIVNLTANYVMRMITEGISFDEACKMAIKEGIGETDMSDDLTGLDSARKAIIISNAIFGQNLRLKDLKYEGIRNSPDKNMRLLVTAGIDEKFTVTSRIESLETGDSFLRLDPMAMSMRMGFVGRSMVTVSEDTDGPVETAGGLPTQTCWLIQHLPLFQMLSYRFQVPFSRLLKRSSDPHICQNLIHQMIFSLDVQMVNLKNSTHQFFPDVSR